MAVCEPRPSFRFDLFLEEGGLVWFFGFEKGLFLMPLGVEGLAVFEDAEHDAQEAVHACTHNAHGGFAGGLEPRGSGLDGGVALMCAEGGHVERPADLAVAGFAHARFAAQGGSGGGLPGVESGKGCGLGGGVKAVDRGQFGQKDGGGGLPHAGDGAEE